MASKRNQTRIALGIYLPVLISLLLPVVLCGLLLGIPVLINNLKLMRFSANLYGYPLPPKSEVVERRAEVGLQGNGNHCDFRVEQMLVTKSSQQEVEAFYDDVWLPAVDSSSQGARDGMRPVFVSFEEDSPAEGQLHFTIRIFDWDHPPGLDFRCH